MLARLRKSLQREGQLLLAAPGRNQMILRLGTLDYLVGIGANRGMRY